MTTPRPVPGWTLRDWQQLYVGGSLSPRWLLDWAGQLDATDPVWISVASAPQITAQVVALEERLALAGGDLRPMPLFGVPFAVKDNIDAAGWITTAACRAFGYRAGEDATIVRLLREAGAVLVGKTNLDQFATGLVGTRSPYGTVASSLDSTRIGGGSSSGSAGAVARGMVPFALGTDTAGSGRVPAAFHNIVGLKPTRGRFSTRGLVPACRTLDCPSIFTLSVDDAAFLANLLGNYDPEDPYSRRTSTSDPGASVAMRVGVPMQLEFFGDEQAREAFEASQEAVAELGIELVPIEFSPFHALAGLLYSESWVAERALVATRVLEDAPGEILPVVRGILERADAFTAKQSFSAEYRRAELSRAIDQTFDQVDALLVPTTPTCYTLEEVHADPLGTNSRLGTYTNFTNLADLCALAVPGRFRKDGFPAGLTLLARAFQDHTLVHLGRRIQAHLDLRVGALGLRASALSPPLGAPFTEPANTGASARIAVLGAHLRGMALCHQLTERGAKFLSDAKTSPMYRLQLISETEPQKPALRRVSGQEPGASIDVELWMLPIAEFGAFAALVPAPLGIGRIELSDGSWVQGFICEPWGFVGAVDITRYGGFRAWVDTQTAP